MLKRIQVQNLSHVKVLRLSLERKQFFWPQFSKVSLLRAYIFIHKFDVICISETFLNSDTTFNDDNLKIEGYNIALSDHPSNSKRGGVCIYYNQSLALKILDIKYLKECINFQILIANKLCNFISLYRSPSEPTDIFDQVADNFE